MIHFIVDHVLESFIEIPKITSKRTPRSPESDIYMSRFLNSSIIQGMLRFREHNFNFCEIKRIFISGCSSAGKTFFARQLIENSFIQCERIYYFHPDIQESFPVDWENHVDIPICYQSGIPSEKDLLSIPRMSCIILDDLYTEACSDRVIDYLFRVLSSKRKLNVIIMTQRYFAEGSSGLSIRNNCNYHVLMANADERTNIRVANMMNCRDSIKKAIEINKKKLYPYIFIDKTNSARVTGVQVYTDLFSRYKQVVIDSMVSYIISEADFKAYFKSIDNHTAVHVDPKPRKDSSSNRITENAKEASKKCNHHNDEQFIKDSRGYNLQQRRQLECKIRQALRRYKIRSKL